MKNINWKKIGLTILNAILHFATLGLSALQTKIEKKLKLYK